MTTNRRRGGNRRGRRRPAIVAAVLATALVGGSCADEADGPDAATGPEVGEFAASREYLTGVAEATDGLTYRVSMDMTMTASDGNDSFDIGGTIMTGEADGQLTSMTMDMSELYAEMADQFPADQAPPDSFLEADLTTEVVTDGTTGYLRAPYFAALRDAALDAGATPADLGPLADIAAAVGDEWGSVDLSQVSTSEVASASGQSADPGVYLDMLVAGTDVREIGAETIDGVETRGLGATITFGDLVESEGMDEEDFARSIVPDGGASSTAGQRALLDEVVETVFAMEIPVQAWVDGDDRVRRVSLDLDMTDVLEDMAETAGEELGPGGVSIAMVMYFTDYGDESIEIEVPTGSVDITDQFRALVETGAFGAGATTSPFGNT